MLHDDSTRRDFMKTLVYVTPTVLTLQTTLAHASPGSLFRGTPPPLPPKDDCHSVGGAPYPCTDSQEPTR